MSKHTPYLAYEMQKFTKPLSKRLFHACARWAAIVLALATVGFVLAGCDDAAAQADREDAEALSSREWAGQQVCGPERTAVWRSDKELECLPTRAPMVTQ